MSLIWDADYELHYYAESLYNDLRAVVDKWDVAQLAEARANPDDPLIRSLQDVVDKWNDAQVAEARANPDDPLLLSDRQRAIVREAIVDQIVTEIEEAVEKWQSNI